MFPVEKDALVERASSLFSGLGLEEQTSKLTSSLSSLQARVRVSASLLASASSASMEGPLREMDELRERLAGAPLSGWIRKQMARAADLAPSERELELLRSNLELLPRFVSHVIDRPLDREWIAQHRESLGKRPVILVPGVGGSRLAAYHPEKEGEKVADVYLSLTEFNSHFTKYLGGKYDYQNELYVSKGEIEGRFRILPEEAESGLASIEYLCEQFGGLIPYYATMAARFERVGYVRGKTLFGHPFDWRQSPTAPVTLDGFQASLERAVAASGGEKADVVTHSYGGLVAQAFMARRPSVAKDLIATWTAIGVPFAGVPSKSILGTLYGYNFQIPMLSPKVVRAMSIHAPVAYETLPYPQAKWRGTEVPAILYTVEGKEYVVTDPEELVAVIEAATERMAESSFQRQLYDKTMAERARTFELQAAAAEETQIPQLVVYGDGIPTPSALRYEAPLGSLAEMVTQEPEFVYGKGDMLVLPSSALASGYPSHLVGGVHAFKLNHVELLFAPAVVKSVLSFLAANEHEPR